MRKLLPICLLVLLALSCGSDPTVDKAHFPTEISMAVCQWYFTCCDAPERQALEPESHHPG